MKFKDFLRAQVLHYKENMISLLYLLRTESKAGMQNDFDSGLTELHLNSMPGVTKTWIKIYKRHVLKIDRHATVRKIKAREP